MPLKWENINFNFIFRLSKFGPTSEATLEAENLIAFSLAMQRHFRKAEEHFNEIIKVAKKPQLHAQQNLLNFCFNAEDGWPPFDQV